MYRIRSIDIPFFVDGIFCFHRHITLRIDSAIHLGRRMGVRDTDGSGDGKCIATIGYSGNELASRSGVDARISFTGNHSLLAHLSRHIAMKLCPADIDRHAFYLFIEQIELRHFKRNFVLPRCIDGHILLRIEVAVIHVHIRIHMTDAHIETKTHNADGKRLDRRTSI